MKFGVGPSSGNLSPSSTLLTTSCPSSTYTVPFFVATLLLDTLLTILLVTLLYTDPTTGLLQSKSSKSPST